MKTRRRVETRFFRFVFNPDGSGRLGVSLSKKVLRHAVARNRVRRLLREGFRLNPRWFSNTDLHVIGLEPLGKVWREWTLKDVVWQLEKVRES